MKMINDGVEVYCLPDGACCTADDERRCPLDVDECPLCYEECSGDCVCYTEEG